MLTNQRAIESNSCPYLDSRLNTSRYVLFVFLHLTNEFKTQNWKCSSEFRSFSGNNSILSKYKQNPHCIGRSRPNSTETQIWIIKSTKRLLRTKIHTNRFFVFFSIRFTCFACQMESLNKNIFEVSSVWSNYICKSCIGNNWIAWTHRRNNQNFGKRAQKHQMMWTWNTRLQHSTRDSLIGFKMPLL